LVTVAKDINDIRDIAMHPPIKTIERLLEAVFSVGSTSRLYSEDPSPAEWKGRVPSRVEGVSNTSTVTLRVVKGDEKGSLKSETVKYGCESQGTRTRERLRWQSPAAYTKDRPVLSSERVPQKARP
jgi:hypothetical protein